jgi:signal transduction histidine kinase
MFLSALTERLGLVVGAVVLISAAHLYTMSHFVGLSHLLGQGYTLRLPFLFVVALFFGHLVQDARGREREAEETQARELRMEFLATVSHDLKNPLGTIQSLAFLLLDGDAGALNGQQTDLVRRIHASTRQVINVALNLLDAARIESGKLLLRRAPANLATVVDDALVLARTASELKGLDLQCAVDADLPLVHIDAVQIERVISNLLGNAIKFTPPGGSVELSVRRAGQQIALVVSDTGPGIPEDELPTLFEKYRQGRNNRIEGSGFGLFIVKAVVEAHGGTVDISSTVGQGTAVTVYLPVSRPKVEQAADSDRESPEHPWPHLLNMEAPANPSLS